MAAGRGGPRIAVRRAVRADPRHARRAPSGRSARRSARTRSRPRTPASSRTPRPRSARGRRRRARSRPRRRCARRSSPSAPTARWTPPAEGDAQAARRWLLIREFRTATRFTRPGADATIAVTGLARGKLSPARRAQGRSPRTCSTPTRAGCASCSTTSQDAKPRPPAREAAAQAAGYFEILADRYEEDRGAAATATAARRAFAGLRAADAARDAIAALRGFTAAPLTLDEQARRAQQLLQFLALVPVEYGRGVNDGKVTKDFEIQEAVAFESGTRAALADLTDALAKRDAAATPARRRRSSPRCRATSTAPPRPRTTSPTPTRSTAAGKRVEKALRARDARRLGGADRRVRLRPDRADARPHGGRRRRRPVPAGRAGPARGLRVLRVRPGAAAAGLRPGPRARRRGPDLVRRARSARPGQADRRPRARSARSARTAARSTRLLPTPPRRWATAPTARPSSPTRRSSSSARASRACSSSPPSPRPSSASRRRLRRPVLIGAVARPRRVRRHLGPRADAADLARAVRREARGGRRADRDRRPAADHQLVLPPRLLERVDRQVPPPAQAPREARGHALRLHQRAGRRPRSCSG